MSHDHITERPFMCITLIMPATQDQCGTLVLFHQVFAGKMFCFIRLIPRPCTQFTKSKCLRSRFLKAAVFVLVANGSPEKILSEILHNSVCSFVGFVVFFIDSLLKVSSSSTLYIFFEVQ